MKIILFFAILLSSATAQTIAGGWYNSLRICPNGNVWSWGKNDFGQLGNGTNNNSNVPVLVSSIASVKAVKGGNSHSIALKIDSTVWSWGKNVSGQLGNGTNNNSNIPVHVNLLNGIIAIAGGCDYSMALKNDGTVWAWGNNNSGQLGNGTYVNSNVPLQIMSLTGIIAISSGCGHAFALKNDGTLWAWGSNIDGQLGIGSNSYNVNTPVKVNSLTNVIAVAGGLQHSLALKNDGTAWAWGWNQDGQLGIGTWAYSYYLPVKIDSLTNAIAISGGMFHSVALRNDSTVWLWGSIGAGGGNVNIPTKINSLTNVSDVAAGGWDFSLVLKKDSTVWTWGDNYDGQLGNGSTAPNGVPTQVNGLCLVATSINEIREGSVSIFPNPSVGIFTVNGEIVGANICVYDVLGNCIWKKDCRNDVSQKVDLSCQPKGIYFMEILSEGRRVVRKVAVE